MMSILLLLFAFQEQPALKLPAEVRGQAGALVKVRAETPSKKVRWRPLDAGLVVADRDDVADQRTILVVACKPGRYRLACWTTAGDDVTDLVETVVVVEDGPAPPKPDALLAALRSAYEGETNADKAKHARGLAAVWRAAVGYCQDTELTTAGTLLSIVREAAGKVVPNGALDAVRRRVAEELRASLPTDPDAPLTPELRARAADTFGRIATALEALTR